MKRLFSDYVGLKQRQNVLDYDDLLLYFSQMLQVEPIGEEIAARFDHLLVDEYQDTNRLQADLALRLRPSGVGLTVVGDDAQSVFLPRRDGAQHSSPAPSRRARRSWRSNRTIAPARRCSPPPTP